MHLDIYILEIDRHWQIHNTADDIKGLKKTLKRFNVTRIVVEATGGYERTVVELLADDNGIILPESISPFKVHLISIGASDEVNQGAQNLYDQLAEKGCEVLWDDRDVSPGQKFNDSDLIGIPYQVVISERLLKNDSYEYKARTSTERLTLGLAEIINKISC